MRKIKIFLAITKGTWGGAQKYIYDLVTHLPHEQYEVAVLTGQPGRLVGELEKLNIRVVVVPALNRDINPLLDLWSLIKTWRVLQIERPDILHLNSPKMGLIGALAGRLVGVKKIIYTSHGWPFQEQRSRPSKLFFKGLCWLLVRLAHHTIVISEVERQVVANWRLVTQRLVLIYNGLSPINFLEKKLAREKLNLEPGDLVVGTIAELHRNKGLTYLAQVAGKIDAKFVVIGEGEERKKLKQTKLILAGNIPNAAALLPAFDIFVLPSVKEGLPYVVLEAGLAGLPVIATRVGGIPEIIENGVSGVIVEPRDADALETNIQNLINHPEQHQAMGEKLRARVQNYFSLEQMVRKTREVYEN